MCPARAEDQVAQACPSVTQVGRMTQHLCVQRHNTPSTANILRLNISVTLPTHKPGLDESYWHKHALPASEHGKLHCQQTESLKLLPQTKTYYYPRDSLSEQNTAWKAAQEAISSLSSFLNIIGQPTEDIKTHWTKPAPSPNSLCFTVLILLF